MAELAREIGFTQISVSHEVSPLMKYVGRGDTTVVDAYLSPILRRYVAQVARRAAGGRAAHVHAVQRRPRRCARASRARTASCPARPAAWSARWRRRARRGSTKIIGFDMGGTSTDVSHFDGEFERAFETQVAGVRMRAPMMRIHTVAAGGGSILHFDGARFRVGPDSAGANPGPACYRRGGPLTVTDCNVMLGKLQPRVLPPCLRARAATSPSMPRSCAQKFAALADEISAQPGRARRAGAEGFLTIAVENMANAIKEISIERGHDVTQYALCCFGGAGGQHACRVADALGMTTRVHPSAGRRALGLWHGLADVRVLRERAVEAPLRPTLLPSFDGDARRSGRARPSASSRRQGVPRERVTMLRSAASALCRHRHGAGRGRSATARDRAAGFEAAHRQRFGFVVPDKRLMVEAVSVEVVGETDSWRTSRVRAAPAARRRRSDGERTQFASRRRSVARAPVYERDDAAAGRRSRRARPSSARPPRTIVVEPGWRREMDRAPTISS